MTPTAPSIIGVAGQRANFSVWGSPYKKQLLAHLYFLVGEQNLEPQATKNKPNQFNNAYFKKCCPQCLKFKYIATIEKINKTVQNTRLNMHPSLTSSVCLFILSNMYKARQKGNAFRESC